MRVLVTGATGFLGRHLVDALLSRGHHVVALVRASGSALPVGVEARVGDVLDAASLLEAAKGCEVVLHCAGKVSRDPRDAELLYRLHVGGTKNVVSACKHAGVRRLVHASTSGTVAVSDDPDHVSVETDETPIGILARWPYYRAKLFAERAALAANGADLEVVSVNPTLLLGPGDVHGSSTEDVRLFLERKIPAVPPGGISWVDARDAALGMVQAMDAGRPGERYLLGATNCTMREFFGRLERVSGVRAPIMPMPRVPGLSRLGAELLEKALSRLGVSLPVDPVSVEMASYFWYLDPSKAERELGWAARDPMVTLFDTVEDLRARGVVWPDAARGNAAE
jgi:dihydroflavonol-4-reductase